MFRPKLNCKIERVQTGTNVYGEREYGDQESSGCSLISMSIGVDQTTVRVDSGASRGKGYENVGYIRLAFGPRVGIKKHDKVTVLGETYSVDRVMQQPGRVGCIEYVSAECSIWRSA